MITSTANQQVRQLIQLNRKGKLRDAQDLFVAEGPKMFREASKGRIKKAYMSESYFEKQKGDPAFEQVEYEVVADSVFRTMCDTQTPQGIVCLIRQYHYTLEELLQRESRLFLVLENLQDPGNLGTIMRTAEGAGAAGVILNRGSVDMYNPKVVRSTMGSIYRVPFLYAQDLREVLKSLKQAGVRSFAARLDGSKAYDRESYEKGAAFLIGNESSGLSKELADCADAYIRIPMEGRLESLNASVAASILLYEAYRQRRKESEEFPNA